MKSKIVTLALWSVVAAFSVLWVNAISAGMAVESTMGMSMVGGQDSKPESTPTLNVSIPDAPLTPIEVKGESAKDFMLIVSKFNTDEQRKQNLITQFMASNPDAKKIQEHEDALSSEMLALRTKLFTEYKLTPETHDLVGDAETTPKFVPRKK